MHDLILWKLSLNKMFLKSQRVKYGLKFAICQSMNDKYRVYLKPMALSKSEGMIFTSRRNLEIFLVVMTRGKWASVYY